MSELWTPQQRLLQEKLLGNGILFPAEFKDRLRALILEGMRGIPAKQFFVGNLMQAAILGRDNHLEGVFSWGSGLLTGPHTTYQSYGVPRIRTGIANGRYLLGLAVAFSANTPYHVAISVNGVQPLDSEALLAGPSGSAAQCMLREIDLTNDNNNSLELMGKIPASASATFDSSHVALFRLGNT